MSNDYEATQKAKAAAARQAQIDAKLGFKDENMSDNKDYVKAHANWSKLFGNS